MTTPRAARPIAVRAAACVTIGLAAPAVGCGALVGGVFDQVTLVDAGAGDDGGSPGPSGDGATPGSDGAAQDGATCTPTPADCTGRCGTLRTACGALADCGTCAPGSVCGGAGANVCGTSPCSPSCANKACGASDGCGGVCKIGACGAGQRCVAGACTCDPSTCAGCCAGAACATGTSDTACGKGGASCVACDPGTTCGTGDCGTCGGDGQPCCAGSKCSAPFTCGGGGTAGTCGCTPSCAGKACGADDGCGVACETGSCGSGLHCSLGACVCDGTSCGGCCTLQGACDPGTDVSACGKSGESCEACTSSSGTPTCTNGVCGSTTTGCTGSQVQCGAACCTAYGNPTPFTGTGTYTADSLCVRPVSILTTGTVEDLALIAQTTGTHVVMGLYADNGGVPGALVTQTAEGTLNGGALVLPTTSAAGVAATTFWIAAVFDGSATVDEDRTATSVTAYCATMTFGTTLPSPFPTTTSYQGSPANWYVLVK